MLGPARPTAELASLDRERLAEAKLIGGLPEARKVIQQLHAEVASTRRIKSQYLTNYNIPHGSSGASAIQLRSASTFHLSPLTRNLPKFVAVITPCGSKDMWLLRTDKLYTSYTERTDVALDKGVYLLEFGVTRNTVDEARRDAQVSDPSTASSDSMPVHKEEMAELGSTTHKIPQLQESVWGYCAVAELVIENKTAYVGVCIFCDVILTAGPARGSKSSAESDAFQMVSDVLASGISYAASHYLMPQPNPAEDIFVPTIGEDDMKVEDEDDNETNVPITPSGPAGVITTDEDDQDEEETWSSEEERTIVDVVSEH